MQFKNIIGSEDSKAYLRRIVEHATIPHAQLLWGNPGCTALPLALALVTYLHCENKQANDACGQCDSCTKMTKLLHPDLIWVFPMGNISSVKKENQANKLLRTWTTFIQDSLYSNIEDWALALGSERKQLQIGRPQIENMQTLLGRKPFQSKYKTFLVWLPEYCHPVAANAMLKIVEEPRPFTIFIFISLAYHHILPTLRSRMCHIHVPNLTDEEIASALYSNHPKIASERMQEIVQITQGDYNQAQKIAAGEVNNYFEVFAHWLRSTYRHQWKAIVDSSEEFHHYTLIAQKNWVAYAIEMISTTLHASTGNQPKRGLSLEAVKFCNRLSKTVTLSQLEAIVEQFLVFQNILTRNTYMRLAFLSMSLRVASIFRKV
ncbi:MAG: hypothetical protein AAF770_02615 [Bacteroidota bacterium]